MENKKLNTVHLVPQSSCCLKGEAASSSYSQKYACSWDTD